MHAPIGLPKITDEIQSVHSSAGYRVEESNLDIRVLIDEQQVLVWSGGKYVIQKKSDTNASIGCLEKSAYEWHADPVVCDQVVLNIDRAFCVCGHSPAGGQRFDSVDEEVKGRFPRGGLIDFRFLLSEVGIGGGAEGEAFFFRIVEIDGGAAGCNAEHEGQGEPRPKRIVTNIVRHIDSDLTGLRAKSSART